jgi:hypothetical protein
MLLFGREKELGCCVRFNSALSSRQWGTCRASGADAAVVEGPGMTADVGR